MILTVVSLRLDNSTGTVAEGMGVVVPGMEMGVESGTGDEAVTVPEGARVIVPEMAGRLHDESTMAIAMVMTASNLQAGLLSRIMFDIRSGNRFGMNARALTAIFCFDLDGHMIYREFFLQ
jgi:hypothetical protein